MYFPTCAPLAAPESAAQSQSATAASPKPAPIAEPPEVAAAVSLTELLAQCSLASDADTQRGQKLMEEAVTDVNATAVSTPKKSPRVGSLHSLGTRVASEFAALTLDSTVTTSSSFQTSETLEPAERASEATASQVRGEK